MRKGAVILAGVALLAACTVQTIQPYGSAPDPGTASQLVGAAGGIVTANDGTTVLIPPMALKGDVTITIGLDTSPPPLAQAHSLQSAHVFGPAGAEFLLPVCITLAFEPAALPMGATEDNVVLYATFGDAGAYLALPTMPADATHVTGMTTQFSEIQVGYGAVKEVDAGADGASCDASGIVLGEAGR